MNNSPNEAEKIEHVARHGQGEAASPSFYLSLANMSKGSTMRGGRISTRFHGASLLQ